MTARILLVSHNEEDQDDRIFTYLSGKGFDVQVRRPFAGDTLRDVTDDLAGTVVYGGKYNAYDTELHPFLNEEYRWIGACIDADVPLLGICQGAQMIARHLGAWAGAPEQERQEFGYYEILPTPEGRDFLPAPLHVAQAHFHTFDLPKDAVHLARSDLFENQAFRVGDNIYGFQFHAEQTKAGFGRWQGYKRDDYDMPGTQSLEEQNALMATHDAPQGVWLRGFLDRFFPDAP